MSLPDQALFIDGKVTDAASGDWFETETASALVRFGYCVPKPYWLIVLGAVRRTGRPLENRRMPDTCQPPAMKLASGRVSRLMKPAQYTSA